MILLLLLLLFQFDVVETTTNKEQTQIATTTRANGRIPDLHEPKYSKNILGFDSFGIVDARKINVNHL
jgi:hypothetical protein